MRVSNHFASFVKGDTVTYAKKCKSIFQKQWKNYAHKFYNFLEKTKSLWSPWSHVTFLATLWKTFHFWTFLEMSNSPYCWIYCKIIKKWNRVYKAFQFLLPIMITNFIISCNYRDWLIRSFLKGFLKPLLETLSPIISNFSRSFL